MFEVSTWQLGLWSNWLKLFAFCPVQVFAVQTLAMDQRAGLSIKGRVKGFVHQWQQAILVNPDACEGCGLCVKACPEGAIRLVRIQRPA